MGLGVLDTRDLLYFLSITLLFVLWTLRNIDKKGFNKKEILQLAILPIGLIVVNIFSAQIGLYERFDLTGDNRYTLSEAALNTLDEVDSPILIDVFLEGDFPSEFRRLRAETKQILEEFSASNKNIKFNFINPIADDANRERVVQQLTDRGLTPLQLNVQESGKSSQELIFPWALASYNDQTVKIPLVKNKIGASQQELVNNSVQNLEYAFADGFSKLVNPKKRKVAVLRGNDELKTNTLLILLQLSGTIILLHLLLWIVLQQMLKALLKIKTYDLIIAAKPTEAFSEEEKLVLDQYTMNGGKSLWLIDAVAMDKDSLYNESGKSFAIGRDLNLTDFFFKYGVRINPVLVNDLYSAPITLAIGEGSQAQFQPVKWQYSPLAKNASNHPIVNNLNLVKFDFANQIDTLKNDIKKTILLKSSPLIKIGWNSKRDQFRNCYQRTRSSRYNKGNQNLAVLLEGEFTSVYNNRIKPFNLSEEKNKSIPTKMIVVADGDVIKNDVGRTGPQELGFDRWTGQTFGNKEFLLNAVNYLLDDNGLINIRSKEIAIAFLDQQKIADQKTKWQVINIAIPLVLLAIFGFVFNY